MRINKRKNMRKDNKKLRAGWSEASKRLHAAGGDKLLIPDIFEDELIDVLDAEEQDFVNELNAVFARAKDVFKKLRKHDGGVRHEKLREKAFQNPEVVKAYKKLKLVYAKKARKAELKRVLIEKRKFERFIAQLELAVDDLDDEEMQTWLDLKAGKYVPMHISKDGKFMELVKVDNLEDEKQS